MRLRQLQSDAAAALSADVELFRRHADEQGVSMNEYVLRLAKLGLATQPVQNRKSANRQSA
jgi:hypothetical protein